MKKYFLYIIFNFYVKMLFSKLVFIVYNNVGLIFGELV